MTRNLIVLACAGLLALAVSISGFAGIPPDQDGDGVADTNDNCLTYMNGPLGQELATPNCDAQEDGDPDGYGSPCDTDTNNDGGTGLDDVAAVFAQSVIVGTNPVYDFNCDLGTGLDDVARVFADSVAVQTPGPSGKACAGTVPCP